MSLRIALFGQAAFGRDVLLRLRDAGFEIVGVYTPPAGRRPDPLSAAAQEQGLPLFEHRYFRRRAGVGFEPIRRILDEYRGLGAELNVLAYVTAILPPEIVDHPRRRSLCFHPSLLPRYRGGAALAWQIIEGERESGVTVFQPDAGVDTGPIVVQKAGVEIGPHDTAASLYFEKLYPLGVEAVVEAVAAVAAGSARYRPQDEAQASFHGLVGEAESRIDWGRPAAELDRLVRGCDPQPGAWAERGAERVALFDGRLAAAGPADAPPGSVLGLEDGRLALAARGGRLLVGRLRVGDGAKLPAPEAGLSPGEKLS
jgi:methionyl-tRNA formyltransferase